MGLWLLSESIRTWQLQGRPADLADCSRGRRELPAGGPRFDPDDPAFLPPGDMPSRIQRTLPRHRATGSGHRRPEIVRCILDSLAAHVRAPGSPTRPRLSGQRIDVIHIVGGGSQNELLCQLIADAAGLPVVAGPVEATALGNLLVQARTHGVLTGDLWSLRAELRAAVSTRPTSPDEDCCGLRSHQT